MFTLVGAVVLRAVPTGVGFAVGTAGFEVATPAPEAGRASHRGSPERTG